MSQPADHNLLSAPVSPTRLRVPSRQDSHHSADEPDERSPLLRRSRSRARIQNHDTGSVRHTTLPRNQSYQGMSRFQAGHRPPLVRSVAYIMILICEAYPSANQPLSSLPPTGSVRSVRHHSRNPSWSSRLIHALSDRPEPLAESKGTLNDERVWYDQFTSTDWVHDNIAHALRLKELRSRKDFRGRLYAFFDAAQGWILSFVCGVIIALIAYGVNVSESVIFDFKDGYCGRAWYLNEKVRAVLGEREKEHEPLLSPTPYWQGETY